MYAWEYAVQIAINETQTRQLHARIMDAEELIFTRTIELSFDSRTHDAVVERAALELASEKLMHSKKTLIGWSVTDFVAEFLTK